MINHHQNVEFDAEFGQSLCDMFQKELGYACIFVGKGGRIVAASARERIGTIHAIAARIMSGEMDEYAVTKTEADKSNGMREGLNLAIDFDGVRVINIGISGPLEKVTPLARIARFCTTSLLKAQMLERSLGQSDAIARQLTALSSQLAEEATATMATGNNKMEMLQISLKQLESALELMQKENKTAFAASSHTSKEVNAVADSAKQLAASISEIHRNIVGVRSAVASAVEQSRRTETIIHSLSEAAGKIGNVVKLINGIANQTNLLALNATIEAARAGPAGRGFAVVASEVKKLAQQSAEATDEIATHVATIRQKSTEAAGAVTSINLTINNVDSMTMDVAAAMDIQSTATAHIDLAAHSVAAGTDEVNNAIVVASGQSDIALRMTHSVTEETSKIGALLSDLFSRLDKTVNRALSISPG
ncbi:MAG: methyl-accepting chemotaxis protein [Rhodospirillaceae bacterium]